MFWIIFILIILFFFIPEKKSTVRNTRRNRYNYKRKNTTKRRRSKKIIEYVSPEKKGEKAEKRVRTKLSSIGMEKEDMFKDLYINKLNGEYAQIDVLLLTDVGIFVFEVKNYSGWIFGDGNRKNWMQILNYGESKNQFYNPIFQNRNHLIALRDSIPQLHKIPLFSIIVFDGDCELKEISNVPRGVNVIRIEKLQSLVKRIINRRKTVEYSKDELRIIFKKAVKNGKDLSIREQHVSNIKTKIQKDDTQF